MNSGLALITMNPIESLNVDGANVELGVFAVPEMSLSSARGGMKSHDFIMTVRTAAMVDFLTLEYNACVRGLKEDDEKVGGPQDRLAMAGYPNLDQLSGDPEILLDVLGGCLLHEFIGKLSWDGSFPIEYWLDEVTRCQVRGEEIRLSGVCYSRG
jgi:hypothetical protein